MSGENIEIMRRAMEAFNRHDGEGFDAFLSNAAVIVPVRAALEGTVYSGPTAGSQYCSAVEESWEDLAWDVEEFREGSDWILALGQIRGRGRASGATLDARGGWLARFRNGKIASFQTFPDRADALEAAGLEE